MNVEVDRLGRSRLRAQRRYPISGAVVISKWVGESERNLRQLFERVRDNPAGLASARRYLGVYLMGARDATLRFSDLHLRAPDYFRQIEELGLPLTEGALLQAKLKLDVIGPSTRPVTVMRSPSGSPWCWRVRSLSRAVTSVTPNTGLVSSTASGSLTTTGRRPGWRSALER